jgi:hypothetical protein
MKAERSDTRMPKGCALGCAAFIGPPALASIIAAVLNGFRAGFVKGIVPFIYAYWTLLALATAIKQINLYRNEISTPLPDAAGESGPELVNLSWEVTIPDCFTRVTFPEACPCCGKLADTKRQIEDRKVVKSEVLRSFRETTYRTTYNVATLEVPYCERCTRHIDLLQSVNANVTVCFVLPSSVLAFFTVLIGTGILGQNYGVGPFLIAFLTAGIGSIVLVRYVRNHLRAWIKHRLLSNRFSRTCCAEFAITFQRTGKDDQHLRFRVQNASYAEELARANRGELRKM